MRINMLISATVLTLMISCGSQNANHETSAPTAEAVEKPAAASDVVDKVIYLNKSTFIEKVWNYEQHPQEWVYHGDKPCIVDFYADWCGPCRRIAPILDELAKEYAGQIYIYKIDTDKERELASVFNVRGIPSILYVPMTGQPQMQSGAFPKESYVQMIKSVVLQNN